MPKKIGADFKIFYNSTAITSTPASGTAIPSGFTDELTCVRDVSESQQDTAVDMGDRANPKDQAITPGPLTFTVTAIHDADNADYLLLYNASQDRAKLSLMFIDGAATTVRRIGHVGLWNVRRTGQTQGLREAAITTFEVSVSAFYRSLVVEAA